MVVTTSDVQIGSPPLKLQVLVTVAVQVTTSAPVTPTSLHCESVPSGVINVALRVGLLSRVRLLCWSPAREAVLAESASKASRDSRFESLLGSLFFESLLGESLLGPESLPESLDPEPA